MVFQTHDDFGCDLVTTVKLVILYANVGELESPQAKIIGAKYSFDSSIVNFKVTYHISQFDDSALQMLILRSNR